jgi:hypothetical protein
MRFKTVCVLTQKGSVMTRLTEKLRLSSLFIKPTRFLSLLSLSTLHHLCNSLTRFFFSQTLPFFSMDNNNNNLFSDNIDYFDDDFDSSYSLRPNRRLLQQDYRDFSVEKVYLLPYRYRLSLLIPLAYSISNSCFISHYIFFPVFLGICFLLCDFFEIRGVIRFNLH